MPGKRPPSVIVARKWGQVAALDAFGFRPALISERLGIPIRTVNYIRLKMERAEGRVRSPERLQHQVDGAAEMCIDPLRPYLAHEDANVRMGAIRTLWYIFKEKVVIEQALGLLPKVPERIEVTTELGERFKEYLIAVAQRMTPDQAQAFARAMESVNAEDPKLRESLQLITR